MIDETCVFCRIIAGEEMVSIVYEDDRVIAFLDIQPVTTGHTLVVSKEHYNTLFDMPEELAAQCLAVARRLAPGIRKAADAESLNLFSANGRAGGQDVMHFHFHLIPVRDDETFPLHLPYEDARIPSRSELDITAARIGRALNDLVPAAAE